MNNSQLVFQEVKGVLSGLILAEIITAYCDGERSFVDYSAFIIILVKELFVEIQD